MRMPTGFHADMYPLLFAHRGLQTEYPENSMAAFAACKDAGLPGIELDVHITSDEKIVVFHDDTLERIAGSPLHIEKSKWKDICTADIGSHKDDRFCDQRIPLLEDVLANFGNELYFDIELKNGQSQDRGLAPAVAEVIRKVRPAAPILISSFNPLELRRFRRNMPELATAIIYSNDTEVPWYLRSGLGRILGGADGYKPGKKQAASRLKGLTRRWTIPWTVNDPQEANALLQAGATGLVSDDPRPLLPLR